MQIGWRTLQVADKNPQVEDSFPQVRGLYYGFPDPNSLCSGKPRFHRKKSGETILCNKKN
jgi:hypothetical protein